MNANGNNDRFRKELLHTFSEGIRLGHYAMVAMTTAQMLFDPNCPEREWIFAYMVKAKRKMGSDSDYRLVDDATSRAHAAKDDMLLYVTLDTERLMIVPSGTLEQLINLRDKGFRQYQAPHFEPSTELLEQAYRIIEAAIVDTRAELEARYATKN